MNCKIRPTLDFLWTNGIARAQILQYFQGCNIFRTFDMAVMAHLNAILAIVALRELAQCVVAQTMIQDNLVDLQTKKVHLQMK